jgi:hypothetical protein
LFLQDRPGCNRHFESKDLLVAEHPRQLAEEANSVWTELARANPGETLRSSARDATALSRPSSVGGPGLASDYLPCMHSPT